MTGAIRLSGDRDARRDGDPPFPPACDVPGHAPPVSPAFAAILAAPLPRRTTRSAPDLPELRLRRLLGYGPKG